MIETEAKRCPGCQTSLPHDAPQGLCPSCLLQFAVVAHEPPSASTAAQAPGVVLPSSSELAAAFPQLEILELLGQGGMGAVYKARQIKLDRLVALKIVPPVLGRDPAFAGRFTREARALARLSHPHIVAVHDFGEVNGLFYFIMEFVDGINLRQMLQAAKVQPPEALKIVPQVCEALQYAHDQGVVHRDIKPENILLDRRGQVKIADFGLAKLLGPNAASANLTGSRQIMGTPHYMAPEQVEHPLEVDYRADIYSLGVVFYEMLTGELPLGRFLPPSQKVLVDARLDEVVLRTLNRDPGRRYQQVSEIRTAVESILLTPAEEIRDLARVLNLSVTELAGLAVIVLCFGFIGLGLWWTRNLLLLFSLLFVGGLAEKIPWRSSARPLVGLLLAVGGLGLGILGIVWNLELWYFLIAGSGMFRAQVYKFFEEGKRGAEAEAGDAGEECPVPDLTPEQKAIWRVLKKYESDAGLCLVPDLPAEGLHNARKSLEVPPGDRILALLDFTGDEEDCKNSLLFGGDGVYCRGIVREQEVPVAIRYEEFPQRAFVNHGLLVYFGKDQFLKSDPDASPVDCETLSRLFTGLRSKR